MRVLAAGLVVAALLSPSLPARADGGPYIGVAHGVVASNDPESSDGFTTDLELGPTISGFLGYRTGPFRFEGEAYFNFFPVDGQTMDGIPRTPPPPPCGACDVGDEVEGYLSTFALMANGYYDLALGGPWQIFAGAGLGLAVVTADYNYELRIFGVIQDDPIPVVDDSDTVFAYQAKLGLTYEITPSHVIFAAYRFFATEDLKFTDEFGSAIKQDGMRTHAGEIGYRFNF